jgi:hypothetical protein
MTAEVERFQPRDAMPAKIQYAEKLANSGLLPAAFRKQPANVLYAVEYGDMLGLAPMAAITGIHVIEGKPTASAGLISALVRRAGHKLRVSGDAASATCEITRADDPSYTFRVTFTVEDAKTAGLTGKPVWKQYGTSMLKARAITQCARDACEEALFGLHYTPEELGAEVDPDGAPLPPQQGPKLADHTVEDIQDAEIVPDEWLTETTVKASVFETVADGHRLWGEVAARHRGGLCSSDDRQHLEALMTARLEDLRRPVEEVTPSAVIPPPATPTEPPGQETGVAASRGLIGVIHQHFKRLGYENHDSDREERLAFTGRLAGTGPLETSSSLTSEQARHVARQLEQLKNRAELVQLLHPAEETAA